MAKILTNTFENEKNALRQIEFDIQSNKLEKYYLPKHANLQAKGMLVKKRKEKGQFYEELNSNKQVVADVGQKQL
jgi:hypothetical protein